MDPVIKSREYLSSRVVLCPYKSLQDAAIHVRPRV
jgi:hypothetical protein